MRLIDIIKETGVTDSATADKFRNIDIEDVCTDSRKCRHGSLFIAVKGAAADGHKYICNAIDNGAKVILYENEENIEEYRRDDILFIPVKDGRTAEAIAAKNFYGDPTSCIKLVGVTGTNGKTSIATLLYRLLGNLGYECGLISTIANYVGKRRYETINTTPGPVELNRLLAEMVECGCEYCFMEVSSHALDQKRTEGLKFAGAIFTNLTHDHLDYHKTFANYLAAKKKLFDNLDIDAFALTNEDDKNGSVMLQNCKARRYGYSCRNAADFKCRIIEKNIDGTLLNINGKEIWCRFIGLHNAYNITAVYGAAVLLGMKEEEVAVEVSRLTAVSGRLEYFKGSNDIIAAVDYAHTPDALENVLKTLKDLNPAGDLICVFGCGGNRDKTKRPEMGAIAGKYADKVVVTSDNPRFEDPLAIINDIKEGMDIKARCKSSFIPDRQEAVRVAILNAKPGSIILVAGKGHEDYQIVNGVKHHLDDKELIKSAFEELKMLCKA
ncbi:MAG: UDP-N-acetylmuramoyl-L-alanyl-D-glutamate--2,6-diaminopimelate ligase [Bacteroidales bacterium]|nr:UDP-N-acetylmuramoyl-L-alanyl-D-glutamate--2,6-diaminopimelate ligase [Bacteroidales bacterium]